MRLVDEKTGWALRHPAGGFIWRRWPELCDWLTAMRVVDAAELASKPGPWLRGDELEA